MVQTTGQLWKDRTLRLDWDRVLAAWALVLVLILGVSAVVQMAPSLGFAESNPAVQGAKIPQHDPFNLGPPTLEDDLAGHHVDDWGREDNGSLISGAPLSSRPQG
jgi:hypothetical protein